MRENDVVLTLVILFLSISICTVGMYIASKNIEHRELISFVSLLIAISISIVLVINRKTINNNILKTQHSLTNKMDNGFEVIKSGYDCTNILGDGVMVNDNCSEIAKSSGFNTGVINYSLIPSTGLTYTYNVSPTCHLYKDPPMSKKDVKKKCMPSNNSDYGKFI